MGPDGDGGDQAIDELAKRLPLLSTRSVKCRSCLVVHRFRTKCNRPGEEPAQLLKVLLIAGPRKNLHANGVTRGDLSGQQIIDPPTCRRTGIAQKLDPGGRVDENHELLWVRISSRSPFQPEPRS